MSTKMMGRLDVCYKPDPEADTRDLATDAGIAVRIRIVLLVQDANVSQAHKTNSLDDQVNSFCHKFLDHEDESRSC